MSRSFISVLPALLILALATPAIGQKPKRHATPMMGSTGGAYFLCEPGELVIEIEKRDRNRTARNTELQAVLVGPDREVIETVRISDDGKPAGSGLGPIGKATLRTTVPRSGIYGLNITVSNDRYGDHIYWRLATNCDRFLVETSRGHRDERRREPIVLANPDQSADICFLPRPGAFAVEVTALPQGSRAPMLFDAENQPVAELIIDEKTASAKIPENPRRGDRPWRLHLPSGKGIVAIEGVTEWSADDRSMNLPLWSPSRETFFHFQDYRWLLFPYRRLLYGEPGGSEKVAFQVHNNSPHEIEVDLTLEFPETPWPVSLSADQVALPPGKHREVTLEYQIPEKEGASRTCFLRATPRGDAGLSTYSKLTVRAGEAPAEQPLELPLELAPYQHENALLGHRIDFPTDNQIYFSPENRPFVRTAHGVARLEDDRWQTCDFDSLGYPREATSKVAFDQEGNVYTLAGSGRDVALMRSTDGGRTFAAWKIPNPENRGRSYDIEQFSGHNTPAGPPPLVRYTMNENWSDPRLRWRREMDIELILPEESDGKIVFAEPRLLSSMCLGASMHSGIPSSVVSRGDRVHVTWAEATDPEEKVPGVPTYVVTYDRRTQALGEKAMVGYGPPPNDVHNTPSITIDGDGYLHVLIGTHGRPFQYVRSREPNDAAGGWTEPAPMGNDLRQTYVGFVCGPDGTLHAAYRYWQTRQPPFPLSHHGTLAWQCKPPGKPWSSPEKLVVAPFSEYSIFYHRLTIDRLGRLMLSYDYWSTYWFYRTDHFGTRRNLMFSPDGGKTWQLATTEDLAVQE